MQAARASETATNHGYSDSKTDSMYKFKESTGELTIDTKVFKVDFGDDRLIGLQTQPEKVGNILFTIADYPNLMLQFEDNEGFGTGLFTSFDIRRSNGHVVFKFGAIHDNMYWKQRWGLSTFFGTMNDVVNEPDVKVANLELKDEWRGIELDFIITEDFYFQDQLSKLVERLQRIIYRTEALLTKTIWKKEFESDERFFCTDLLFPLIRKMGFIDIRYKHGVREYGKDFTFSEISKFGNLRHFGLQAKAGNIRGSVNSDIDEIIGQLEDAFSMPYHEVSANEVRHISVFIVATSGYFTENAKEKIIHKVPAYFRGCVYFMDKDKLGELMERCWK